VLAEQMEGEQINAAEHALLCSTLVRIGHRIGLDRIPREIIDPTLEIYERTLREDNETEEAE
jgi:hypothetical protein